MPPDATVYGGYPDFHFEGIKQDSYDLLFEIWDVAVESGNGYDYFDEQTVLDMGSSGAFAGGEWYEHVHTACLFALLVNSSAYGFMHWYF